MNEIQSLNIDNVSKEQIRVMRHALGLNRKAKPYRNYFNCSATNADWNDLVDKGFAKKHGAWTSDTANFSVTFDAAKILYGKRMSRKYFDEL